MSFFTVVGHRFGLYGETLIILSTSKMGPVPSALISATGRSFAILIPEFKQHVRIVVRKVSDDEVRLEQLVNDRGLNHIATLFACRLYCETGGINCRGDQRVEQFIEEVPWTRSFHLSH